MTEIAAGMLLRSVDAHQPAVTITDDTTIANIVATGVAYVTGSPEVGIYFVGPLSGRVRITTGGGLRDNGVSPNIERVFLVPQVFETDANGEEILAPTSENGFSTAAENTEFAYGSRVIMLSNLDCGKQYYARVMYAIGVGTDPDTADIAARDISVIQLP